MKIIFTKTFERWLLKLEDSIQKRIIEKISQISEQAENLDIKKLQPKEQWFYRLRVWKYRIIFTYIDDAIKLLKVDNRDSIYFNI